jgi:hypothetical protein
LIRSIVASTTLTASAVTGMPSRNLSISASAGVGQRFEPRQVEEAAGALDGMDEAENVGEDFCIVGLLLEANQLDVDDIDAFVRFGEEFPQQVVHGTTLSTPRPAIPPAQFGSVTTVLANGLILVALPIFGTALRTR